MVNKFIIRNWLIWLSLLTVLSCQELGKNYLSNITRNTEEIAGVLQNNVKKQQTAIINEYVEILLNELNNFTTINSMDIAPMPDLESKFKKRILLVTYHGIIYLKNGWLSGLDTIKLNRNAIVTYEYPNLKVRLSLGYKNLKFIYDYKSKFMNIGPKGQVHGTIKNFKFTIDLQMNMTSLKTPGPQFTVNSLGSSSIRFTGDILTDFLKNLFTPVIKPLVKPIVKSIIEQRINKGLQTITDYYNNGICWLLQGC